MSKITKYFFDQSSLWNWVAMLVVAVSWAMGLSLDPLWWSALTGQYWPTLQHMQPTLPRFLSYFLSYTIFLCMSTDLSPYSTHPNTIPALLSKDLNFSRTLIFSDEAPFPFYLLISWLTSSQKLSNIRCRQVETRQFVPGTGWLQVWNSFYPRLSCVPSPNVWFIQNKCWDSGREWVPGKFRF